jgi:hypothetical protein
MQFRGRRLGWAGSAVLAMAAVLTASLSAAADSPRPGPIYKSLVGAREGLEPANPAPIPIDDIRRILEEESAKATFDGVVQGWRLAPDNILEAEGRLDRNLSRKCEPRMVDGDAETALDFTLTYIPAKIEVQDAPEVTKWSCDGEALSVTYLYSVETALGLGDLMVYRAIWGQRSLDLLAPSDKVTEGSVNGAPAIFVAPADAKTGLGTGQIIVIEDDTGPEFTVLRVSADNGIPFEELVKIAEGIR